MGLVTRTAVHAGVIEVFDDVATNCAELIRIAESAGDWAPAKIGHGLGEEDPHLRDNDVAFFNPYAFTIPMPIYHMARTVWEYLNDYAIRYEVMFSSMEPVNINRYRAGQRYKPHADDGPTNRRIISALLYMNDVDAGGETEFIYFGVNVKPKAGRLVIFPSNFAYAHAAHPPLNGVKYSAAFWTNP